MTDADLIRRAFEAFRDDAREPPPLTLRGGSALDDYQRYPLFDAAIDVPTDQYLEQHAFWGLGYLDARSWRHYLPRLMEYAIRRPEDPAMVVEALVRSMRPPDRYPPRLGSLTEQQEEVVRAFLEMLAQGSVDDSAQKEAQQALEEWWWPHPRARPTAADVEALRRSTTTYREVSEDGYRLMVPETLTGSGVHDIPSESRRVQTWGGYVCGDVSTMVAVNVTPRGTRSPLEVMKIYAGFFGTSTQTARCEVSGAHRAVRLDGVTFPGSPADPHTLIMIVAEGAEVVALTMHAHDRPDVRQVLAQIAESFAV